jgi:hypothetical protein
VGRVNGTLSRNSFDLSDLDVAFVTAPDTTQLFITGSFKSLVRLTRFRGYQFGNAISAGGLISHFKATFSFRPTGAPRRGRLASKFAEGGTIFERGTKVGNFSDTNSRFSR